MVCMHSQSGLFYMEKSPSEIFKKERMRNERKERKEERKRGNGGEGEEGENIQVWCEGGKENGEGRKQQGRVGR